MTASNEAGGTVIAYPSISAVRTFRSPAASAVDAA
jgi:hypothetical protein